MRKKQKNPVLTSPWKIGMFVALMLAVTSTGVGFYFVHFYNVDLPWLGSDVTRWIEDSWSFFKETYPLAAGVVIISLMTYFIIASAVRRYKFYLSSGQDYRKMVQLADSIDDLTNPAQIARLGEYPELQDILRSYGDQIREISEEMGSREEERSVDLEMEVESILAGGEMKKEISEGKWWAPIVQKVNEHVRSVREELENTKVQAEKGRRTSAQTALSLGRVMESLGGSNEDIIGIARTLGSLNSVVSELESGSIASTGGTTDTASAKALIGEALDALKNSSRTLHGFSEENNGLALNIALMAARGDISEHDLAQFAEKVRSTAERFNKLGMEMADIAGKVSDGLSAVGGASYGASGPATDGSRITSSIRTASGDIDRYNQSLQEKVTMISHELDALNESVHRMISEENRTGAAMADQEEAVAESSGSFVDDPSLVNFGDGTEEAHQEEELVLDRSNIWQAGGLLGDQPEAPEDAENGMVADSDEQSLSPGSGTVSFDDDVEEERVTLETPAAKIEEEEPVDKEEEPLDISEIGEELAGGEERADEVEEASRRVEMDSTISAGPQPGEDMMEMPGHKWVKIDMEEAADTPDAHDVTPETAGQTEQDPMVMDGPSAGPASMEDDTDDMFMERVTDTIRGVAGLEGPGETNTAAIEEEKDEDDPIYDLFELGAVEYVDQAPGL
ncbi:MAG TPA: hypothetical protein VLA34_08985 [Candidatus Krumholzibacterium sp.]|nr:hypothetical protein [Candidatus Krumholzibacterium sp.]